MIFVRCSGKPTFRTSDGCSREQIPTPVPPADSRGRYLAVPLDFARFPAGAPSSARFVSSFLGRLQRVSSFLGRLKLVSSFLGRLKLVSSFLGRLNRLPPASVSPPVLVRVWAGRRAGFGRVRVFESQGQGQLRLRRAARSERPGGGGVCVRGWGWGWWVVMWCSLHSEARLRIVVFQIGRASGRERVLMPV